MKNAVAYASFRYNPSFARLYICTARVLPELKRPVVTFATAPAVNISTAVSPTIRPVASIIPESIAGKADGSITLTSQ